jgi:hypothetical protein
MSDSGGFHWTVNEKKTIKNRFEPEANEMSLLNCYLGHGAKEVIKYILAEII